MILLKYIVIFTWVLILVPVAILIFNGFINAILPTPKNNDRFFSYLLNNRLFYLNALMWVAPFWFHLKKELGFVPVPYALQQVGWSLVFMTILLLIKYYKSRRILKQSDQQS